MRLCKILDKPARLTIRLVLDFFSDGICQSQEMYKYWDGIAVYKRFGFCPGARRHSCWCSCNSKGNYFFIKLTSWTFAAAHFSPNYDDDDDEPGSDEDAAEDEEGGGPLVEELEAPVVDRDGVDLKETAGDLCHRSD